MTLAISPYADLRFFPREANTITLYWRGWFGTLGPAWYPDSNSGLLLRQFIIEAKRRFDFEFDFDATVPKLLPEIYDQVLRVAGDHDYSITAYGGPEDDAIILEHRRKVRERADGVY